MFEPPVLTLPPRPDKHEESFLYWHTQHSASNEPSLPPQPTAQSAVPTSLQNNLILGVFEAIIGPQAK